MVTGKMYADKAVEVYNLKPKAGYIWGQAGALWTAQKQANLKNKYLSDPKKYSDYKLGAEFGDKWIGHKVWDCSGLTKWSGDQLGLSFHHGSNSSWKYDCQAKGKMTKGLKLPVGAWVYTGSENSHGHIGIVVDEEWVVEAMGTKTGVTKTKITAPKWTFWGLAKGIEFDFIPEGAKVVPEIKKVDPPKKVYSTLRRGAKGELVRELQTLLAKDGSTLAIDGIFGPGTQSAVRSFQKKHNLLVDGIVGKQTWGALFKL